MVLGLVGVAALVVAGCGSEDGDDGSGTGSGSGSPSTTGADGGDAGGAGGAEVTAADLEGRTFTSTAVTGRELVAGSSIRLTFEGGNLGVNAGCNQSTGAFVLADGALRWDGPAASTQMACEDELMAQDAWLATLFEAGVDAALDGEALTLAADDVTIELVDEGAQPDAPLVGGTWSLASIVANEAVSSVPAEVEAPTLTFADDGTVAVFTGCNRGSGPFELDPDGASATVGPIAITKMFCEGAAGEVEASVLAVLDGEVQVERDGEQLTLTKGDAGLVYQAG